MTTSANVIEVRVEPSAWGPGWAVVADTAVWAEYAHYSDAVNAAHKVVADLTDGRNRAVLVLDREVE